MGGLANKCIAAISFILVVSANTSAAADVPGEIYTCHFGHYGEIQIDTREPNPRIILNGARYPASSGSYFYSADNDRLVIEFGPGMKFWVYRDVRDDHCFRRHNKPR